MRRKIYNDLIKWKNTSNHKPLMIYGSRQVGKTYIINEFCKKEYNKYAYINLFNDKEIIKLYNEDINSEEKLKLFKQFVNLDFEQKNTALFIDEIQESPELIQELKFFCEMHPKINIIVAGSLLGVMLKRTSVIFPVGKVEMLNLYPMDFEEFLMAFNEDQLIETIKDCYNGNKAMPDILHNKSLEYYNTYLFTGGMPEAVANIVSVNRDYIKFNRDIITGIIDAYVDDMAQYVKNANEQIKINELYSSIFNQLSNPSNKFQVNKIKKSEYKLASKNYTNAMNWLIDAKLILKSYCVFNPTIPLEFNKDVNYFKLYFNDIGLLCAKGNINITDILQDNLGINKGIIAENYVAQSLLCNGFNLYYWMNNNTSEVDFIIHTSDGIIPVEVKSGENTQAKSLKVYMNEYNPKYVIKISTKNFGFVNKVKTVPLYAVFCIKKDII